MPAYATEDTYAEQPTIEWLEELGWTYVHGPDIAPDGPSPEREHWSDVVLRDRLRAKTADLNPELPVEAVDQVVTAVVQTEADQVIRDHHAFHRLLLEGVPVTYRDADGEERSTRAKLVDFEDVTNNGFLAINQVTIIIGKKNRRPDVLLYVNGLPLGQVELKNPADEHATPEAAVNQIAHYRETIPALYRYVEIIGVSDLLQARVGTITTPAEHFAEWKSMDPALDEGKSQLEVMLRGVFEPGRFLDLVESFVLFQTDGAWTWKVMAKYHQVDAVQRAVEATADAMEGDGRAGVVWHTQGAGKSYTMVFYVGKLRRDPRFRNPTIVGLTDRIDLDNQLLETFASQPDLAPTIKHAEAVDTGPNNLRDLLQVPAGGIIFTTIQKFATADGEPMPVLSERENVIVLADEGHRSQYGSFARNLLGALPNAVRIGFTGTPIERGDRSTRLTFGDYVSVYDIGRAVEDGATVPIYYESRSVPVEVADETLLESVEDVLENEEQEAAQKLVTSWSRLEKVVGSDDRVQKVAEDIAEHFSERTKTLDGKGMVVGMSRRICVELTERMRAVLGDDAVDCIISASATDPPEISAFRRSKQEMRDVADRFKDPDDKLRIVVVRDMWLTGFDAPVLHTLYIDKPMKDHGLLQAIARVNRVFRDKPGGLVVDYIGVGEDLRAALPAYASEDVEDVMVPLEEVITKLQEKHDVVREFFHDTGYERRAEMSATERATLLANVVAKVLADDETTRRFLTEHAAFAKLFALVSPDPAAAAVADDAGFFSDVARAARKLAPPEHQPTEAAQQAVKQFFSEGLAAGEVVDILAVADKDRPEISILSDEFLDDLDKRVSNPDLQVALLRKLLNDEIRSRSLVNNMQAKIFSDQLAELLARYQNRQLTSAQVVEALVALAKRMRAARRRHEELGLSEEEAAFYDALAGQTEDWQADDELAEIARELVASIKADLSIDWTSHESREAAIRAKVKRLLRRHHYQPPVTTNSGGGGGGGGGGRGLDFAAQLVLDQARTLYRYWPDVALGDELA